MKQVFARSITELKKSYTNLMIILLSVGSISSFFTYVRILENDLLTSLHVIYFIADASSLILVLMPILVYLEEYLQTTRLAKVSIASLFMKDANHVKANISTILVLISIVYITVTILTSHLFAAAIVFWFFTYIMLAFA